MKKILDVASSKGLKECEVFYRDLVNNEVRFENNNLKNISTSQNSGIGVRGIYNNKIGICSFTHEEDCHKGLDKLIQSSKYSEDKEYDFAKPSKYTTPKIFEHETANISIDKLVADGAKIIDEISRYDKNVVASIIFENEIENIKIVNSNGVDNEYKKSSFLAYIFGQVIDDRNFVEVDCYKYGIDSKYDINLLVNTFIEKIKLSRMNADISSGSTKVLFTPKAFGDIMSTISQGVNGNAVEKGISPLCNRIGEKIFDERFTLIDDATVDYNLDSKPFDDEGIPTKKNFIIESGIIKSYVHSLKTAAKTNSDPTGNGNRGSYDTPPGPSLNNMIILPGQNSFEEMLFTMQDGIIIDEIIGLDLNNLLNGDFGGNVQLGYKVQNGNIVGRIKNVAFNSNIYSILNNDLLMLSNLEYNHPIVSSLFSDKKQPCALFKDINLIVK